MPIDRDQEESSQYRIRQAEESSRDGLDEATDGATGGPVMLFIRRIIGSVLLGIGLILLFGGFYAVGEVSGTDSAGSVDDFMVFVAVLIMVVPGVLIGLTGFRMLRNPMKKPENDEPKFMLLCSRCGTAIGNDTASCASCGAEVDGSNLTLELLTLQLQKGCDINERSIRGNTALHLAVISGQEKLVDFLLQNGADPHLKYKYREAPGYTRSNSDFLGLDAIELAQLMYEKQANRKPVLDLLQHFQDKT